MAKSGQETEVKFHVRRLSALSARIEALGGRLLMPRTHESNLRFDTADEALRREGRALRLRRDATCRLTFKGPSHWADGIRIRDEFETTVGDFSSSENILHALGYVVVFEYEKYRAVYALADTEIMLDELPFGDFVEIEGGLGALRPAAGQLGLDWTAAIEDSYHSLFERLQAAADLPFRDLTFSNFEGRSVRLIDVGIGPADSDFGTPGS
ncbi:MAG: class IV adenylate cyclase [Chloroflexota bacterium]